MATQNDLVPQSSPAAGGTAAGQPEIHKLHMNAIGIVGLVAGAASAVAPLAAMFFNVPLIADQAGAAVPLVFLISAIGMVLFAVSIVYFARRISSAGGLYTWVSCALGKSAGYYAGWLMMGGYALFEVAAATAFGGLTDNTLSSQLGFNIPGGWVTYALLAVGVVSVLTFFDMKWSVRILAPFLALEILSLLVLDIATIVRGGAAGQDFAHTFTTVGTNLKGVFPGGVLGIGVGMALGIWSFVGGEQGVVFGEEVPFPRRAIPYGLFGVFTGAGALFLLTAYAAVIGGGWQHAADTLGNIANAPGPYFDLARHFVGGWLVPVLYITIGTSTFAAIIAFHNGMVRYLYSFRRFLYLTGVAYWLTAHYLGRKHRCSIKKVMRIRYGRDPKSGKKALYTTNETGKRLFLWNKPPKWRSLLNPTVQAKDVQPLPITSWAGGHSYEQRMEARYRAEGCCEHCGKAADKLFVHHPKRLKRLRKPKQGPANVIASAQEQQVKLLCWQCHKHHHPRGWHDGKTTRRQHISGEPDAATSGPSGSEGAGQKRASAMK